MGGPVIGTYAAASIILLEHMDRHSKKEKETRNLMPVYV